MIRLGEDTPNIVIKVVCYMYVSSYYNYDCYLLQNGVFPFVEK